MCSLPYPSFCLYSSLLLCYVMIALAGFKLFGKIYFMYTYIIWTGIFRPFIALAESFVEKSFGNKTFSTSLLLAQMNQVDFFGNNFAIETVHKHNTSPCTFPPLLSFFVPLLLISFSNLALPYSSHWFR